jgi:hypothetical protein
LPAPRRRPAAALAAALITLLVVSASGAPVVAAKAPPGLSRFMRAVGHIESGGRYTARNPVSGAYGKYQILPSNWPAWARQYLGDATARPTPRNQERVAAGKMTSLYRWLGSWRRVAYWWLTGSSRTSGWSASATRYVRTVMTHYRSMSTRATSATAPARRTVNERSSAIAYRGSWRIARHGGYGGGAVRYATRAGASATLTFTGRRVSWHGPTGPTRGQAKVYLDGRYVRTVDLRRSSFDPRATLFGRSWSKPGRHSLRIVVVGTRGGSMVAIDDFLVTR